jgi:iron complex outermembrane receptor protein
VFGANFEQKIGGWDVSNKLNYFSGDLNTIAMFTGNNPLTAADYLAQAIASATTATRPPSRRPAASWPPAAITYTSGGGAVGGEPAGGAGRPVGGGKAAALVHRRTPRQPRHRQGQHTLTVGGYVANYSSHDVWYLGNSHLMTAVPNASLINVTLNNGVVVSNNGTDGNVFAPIASYDGDNTAGFIADEWRINDRIKVDAGMRHERQRIRARSRTWLGRHRQQPADRVQQRHLDAERQLHRPVAHRFAPTRSRSAACTS